MMRNLYEAPLVVAQCETMLTLDLLGRDSCAWNHRCPRTCCCNCTSTTRASSSVYLCWLCIDPIAVPPIASSLR